MFYLCYIINPYYKSCTNKPFYRFLKFSCPCALFYAAINEFLIFFGKLTYKTSEDKKNSSCIDFSTVF